ncbi:MAG: endonuclease MutS2, partial [Myxococcales bacterium]|nr:endonuclease MutS2 [Myxococcales bacterium]
MAAREAREAVALLQAGEPLPVGAFPDLSDSLGRLARGGALDAPALRSVARVLDEARSLRRFLGKRRDEAPNLWAACALDPTLDDLADDLHAVIAPDGTLSDLASPALRTLRREVHNLRAKVVRRLEELLVRHADILQDRFYTDRDGRYVVPVRRDAHERLPGIVHGTSASGASVFVEPRAIIADGNRLTMATAEMAREEARLLVELSAEVATHLPSLEAAVETLDHMDLRAAAARFGEELSARVVEPSAERAASLTEARHPLLVLDGVEVVPNDIAVEGGHALVISGPNAGGKTVALKTLGLCALMVRAGVPIPVGEDSACGFFAPVLSDVGDEQSLSTNLSTFSAHITVIASMLRAANARDDAQAPLVLLDELTGGTDPEEGAALACAIVDALCRAGATTVVTTHYEPLKALGASDARIRNAAVGLDVARMEPTFELTYDVPGASSAFAVALRYGIPADVVEVARSVLPAHSQNVDALVRELQGQRGALAIETAAARAARQQAEQTTLALERAQRAQADRERTALGEAATKLLEAVRRAEGEVRRARKRMREARDEAAVAEAQRQLEEAAKVAAETAAAAAGEDSAQTTHAPLDAERALTAGERVWVETLRGHAEVIEVAEVPGRPAGSDARAGGRRERVRVAAGALRLWVDRDDLRAPAALRG